MRLRRIFSERLYLLLLVQALLAITVVLILFWWSYLIWIQAERINTLELTLGSSDPLSSVIRKVNPSMIVWEAGFFILAIVAASSFIYYLIARDLKRAKSIRAFFAGVTHELRTPLTSIRLQAESLADARHDHNYREKLSQRLLEDTSRLEGQLEKALELARIEGGAPLRVGSYFLNQLIDKILANEERRLSTPIAIRKRGEDVPVIADFHALDLIVRNVFENSRRHAEREDLSLDFNSRSGTREVELTISDNGKGSSERPEDLGQLFFKGRKSQGAGVGLYLIRRLMERMGGSARFSTTPQFSVTLVFRRAEI